VIDFDFFTVIQRASFFHAFDISSVRPSVRPSVRSSVNLRERRLGTVNHDTPTTENGKDNLHARVIKRVVSHLKSNKP
jgi:hypothetical protein